MIRKIFFLIWGVYFLIGYLTLAWPYAYSWKHLANFGPLTDFNLFLTGDFYYERSDVEGQVAVKGDATLKSFSIGLKAPPTPYTFIVGGNANLGGPGEAEGGQINNGGLWVGGNAFLQRVGLPQGDIITNGTLTLKDLTVENGSVIVSGDVNLERVTIEGNLVSNGNININNSSIHGNITSSLPNIEPPINFSAINLQQLASEILDSNNFFDIGTDKEGKIYIDLDKCNGLVCYLDIDEIDFEDAWGIWLESSSPKTAIIHVSPDNQSDNKLNIAYKDFKLLGNISNLNILYIFDSFQEIEMHHIGLQGSILAPGASINFYEGVMYGSLFGNNLFSLPNQRGGQINIPVPEPISFLYFGLFLIVLKYLKKQWQLQ